MEVIGKFVKTLPEQRGTSQKGDWVRGGFVIETEEQFPKQVAFSLWGEDKVAIVRTMTIGTQIKVFFSPESREFKDKYFTDLRCFRIDTLNQAQSNTQAQQKDYAPNISQVEKQPTFDSNSDIQENDDLPF